MSSLLNTMMARVGAHPGSLPAAFGAEPYGVEAALSLAAATLSYFPDDLLFSPTAPALVAFTAAALEAPYDVELRKGTCGFLLALLVCGAPRTYATATPDAASAARRTQVLELLSSHIEAIVKVRCR